MDKKRHALTMFGRVELVRSDSKDPKTSPEAAKKIKDVLVGERGKEQKETEATKPWTWEEIVEEFGRVPAKKLKLRNPERMKAKERLDEFIAITEMDVIPPELMQSPKVRTAVRERLEALLGRAIDPIEIATSMPELMVEILRSENNGAVSTADR